MNKEKYLGEAFLKDDPKKKLNFTLRDGCVTTEKLADGAVTSDKIADGAIDLSKVKIDLDSLAKLNKDNTFIDSKQTYTTADNANTIAALNYESLKFSNKTGAVSTLFGEDCGTYVSIGKADPDLNAYMAFYTIADNYCNKMYFHDGAIEAEYITEAGGYGAVMKPGIFIAAGDDTGAVDSEASMSSEEIHIYDGKHINQFTVTPTKINWVNVSNKHEFGLTHDGYYDSDYTVKDIPSAQKTYIHIGSSDDNTVYANVAPLDINNKVPNEYIDDTNIHTIIQNYHGNWPGYGYSDEKPFITVDDSGEGHTTELVYFNSDTIYGTKYVFDKNAILYSTDGLAFGTAASGEKSIDYNSAPIRYTRYGVDITGKTSKDLLHAAGSSNNSTIHVGTDADTTNYKYVAPLNDEGKVPSEYLPTQDEDKFHTETATDGFYIIDSNKNIGLQYNEEGLDAALVTNHFKELVASDSIGEAPNDGNTYGRKNKSWVKVDGSSNNLWLGNFDQGTINSTSGNNDNTISTSTNQAVSQDVIAIPYIGCTFTIKAPTGYKIKIYYNPKLNMWPYTLASTSEWLTDGDTFTMPNTPQGGDGQATAIQFKLAIQCDGTFDLSTVQNLVDLGEIALLYEGSDVILDHNHQEGQAKNVGAYSTTPQLENIGNIPYFGYLTDIHSDVTRYERFLKYCEYLKVDAAILGGDYTITNATDGFNYLHAIASNYSTKVLPVVGNHDAWQYSTTTMYNKFLKDFGYGSTYYYQDIHNIRIIVLNIYETTNTSYKNEAISQTQMDWLISTLKSTPSTYGILLCYHKPNGTLTEDSTYNTFFTESPNDVDPLKTVTGIEHIIKVIDAYMSKSSVSGTYTSDGGTVSYTADFTSLTSTGEFIAHITGHYHRDLVGYYSGTTNKQLVINTICGNGYSPQHCFSFIRDGRGSSQDGMTFFGINRTTGKVMIARVGADIDVDGKRHDIMYIPYK